MNIFKSMVFVAISFISTFAGDMGSEWVESGTMLRYPSSKYFYGVGRSIKSSEDAKVNSVSAVLNQIVVEVKAIQKSEEYDLVSFDSSKQSSIYESSVRLKSEGKLQGVEIISTAKRGEQFFAFAALSKELFVKNRLIEIKSLQKEVMAQYTSAKKSLEQGDVTATLNYLVGAKKSLKKLNSSRSMLSGAVALTEKESAPIHILEVNTLYNSCLSSIELKIISGNKQSFSMGEVPQKPFVAAVTVADKPAQGVPFSLVNEQGEKILTTTSDKSGKITFFLAEKAESSKGKHSYSVEPNLKISKKDKESLGSLIKEFHYTIKSLPKSVKIVTKLPTPLNGSYKKLDSKVKSLLSKYDLLNDSSSCQKLEVSLNYVENESISGISATRTFINSTVTANFTLTDNNGAELLSFEKSAKGSGSSLESSVAKAVSLLKIKSDILLLKSSIEEPQIVKKEELKSIIILPFKNSGAIANWYDISESITAMIITAAVNSGNYRVIERDQIKKLLDEKKFSEQDIDFAKFAGANLAIIGNATTIGDKIEVDARIVEVTTGVTTKAISASGSSAYQLRAIANKIQVELSKKDGSKRSGNCNK
jgi:TolB-like protein